jgi:phytoene/squalene synthetase
VNTQLETRIDLYTRVAEETASGVIRRYSTSFGLASSILDKNTRQHIENIYSLVRLADEIVDGVAYEAGLTVERAGQLLDALEKDTEEAMASGYSTNLIVHAFAHTSKTVGITSELTRPFFESMRMDLNKTEHTDDTFDAYVYGSAEVVGLMCLEAFLHGHHVSDADKDTMVRGGRALGAAFQKVNFLRDLGADFVTLGRSYFPGVTPDSLDNATLTRLLDDIDSDLALSAQALRLLPPKPRRAVALAHALFDDLGRRLRHTPAEELISRRVRVPGSVKLWIAVKIFFGWLPQAPTRATGKA